MKKAAFPPCPRCRLLPPCGPDHPQTVTLSPLHGMTCSGLYPDHCQEGDSQRSMGVSKVDVTFETREAVVHLPMMQEPDVAENWTQALPGSGYPSSVKQTDHERPKTLLRVSIHWQQPSWRCVCFTPVSVILLVVGRLSALTGDYLTYVLLPARWRFHRLTHLRHPTKTPSRSACCTPKFK